MTDQISLNRIMQESRPDEIYNLAAQSFVGVSWKEPIHTSEVTGLGVTKILEAMRLHAPTAKFYQASTSELFGKSMEKDGSQHEDTPFMPRSPYAIAKLYAYWTVVNYRESYGLYACNGILFNHESPRRGIEFVTRKITDGVARIKLGLDTELRLGNLDAKRDWGFAGDYVYAMWLMLQKEKPVDLVVATGESHSVKQFVAAAFKAAGIKNWKSYVKQDHRYMRPADVETLKGVPTKANKVLKWKPSVSFEALVKMMVDADVERLTNQGKEYRDVREEIEMITKRLETLEK